MKPCFQIIDERYYLFLPDSFAPVRWITTNGGLNLIKLCDALQSFLRNNPALGSEVWSGLRAKAEAIAPSTRCAMAFG